MAPQQHNHPHQGEEEQLREPQSETETKRKRVFWLTSLGSLLSRKVAELLWPSLRNFSLGLLIDALGFSIGLAVSLVTGLEYVKMVESHESAAVLDLKVHLATNSNARAILTLPGNVLRLPAAEEGDDCSSALHLSQFVGRAVLRVSFAPLVPKFPCFGNVHFSFLETPELDFCLSTYAGLDLMSLPGISGLLHQKIQSAIAGHMLWPRRFTLRTKAAAVTTGRTKRAVGTVTVEVVEATELTQTGLLLAQNILYPSPYVKAYIDPSRSVSTATESYTCEPVWREVIRLPVMDHETDALTFEVHDATALLVDSLIGSCVLHVSNLTPGIPQWGDECNTIRNLYSLWFPPADEVKGGPCTLVCNSTTNVVSCDPPPPPDALCACVLYSPTNYTGLSVALSNLSGPIPTSIGGLLHLTYLNLQGNNFSGPIPTELCQLTALQYMFLRRNRLTGAIPSNISLAQNLTNLYVIHSESHLEGPARLPTSRSLLPSTSPFPSPTSLPFSPQFVFLTLSAIFLCLSHLHLLPLLWVDNNTLNGHLPGPLGNLVNLVSLNATNTSLSGSMPSCFASMPNLTRIMLPAGNNFCPAEGQCCSNNLPSNAPESFYAPPNMSCPICSACSSFCSSCQPPPLSTGAIIGIVVAGVVFVAAVLAAIIWWQWRKRFVASKLAEWEEALKRHSFHRFTLRDIRLATNNFNRANLIGQGAFGVVYCAQGPADQGAFGVVYCAQGPADQLWAIKRSRMIAKDASESTVFETEVRTVSRLSHRNLVRLLGYCSERGEQILVYEFVPNGPLSNYLYASHQGACLDFQQRLEVAIGVAEGLAYLHSSTQPAMVHRDIKPANILLDAGWQAKIADFGLVKDLGDNGASVATRVVGTRGYLDPEYFSRDKVTTKADVYSFGVVLMELVTGRPASSVDPTSDNHATIHISSWTIPYVEDGDIAPISDPRIFTPGISEHLLAMSKIAKDCMQLPGKERPEMVDVARMLRDVRRRSKPVLLPSPHYCLFQSIPSHTPHPLRPQLPGKERPEMVDVARMLRDVRRRAFGVGAEEIQLDEVPASPLTSLYSYHHSQPASGYGTDSYIEFSGPVPK
ncbi:unnamed protein product [Closterium sp. NIES-65]|nr:unnamed protein product [Closterium sp. NIES-65]